MGTTIVHGDTVISREVIAGHELTTIEKLAVRSAHPVSIYFQVIAYMWFGFYFWNQLWAEAVLSYMFFRAVGLMATYKVDITSLADTILGRLALLHLEGSNLVVQLAGLIPLLYGIWSHDSRMMLVGLSLVLMGHLQGWSRIDSRLKL